MIGFKNNLRVALLFLLVLIISTSAYSLTIDGTFSDATNYTTYIYNASIKLYDNATNTLITQNTTDVFGRYTITDSLCVIPSIYRIEYSAVGFFLQNDTIQIRPFPPPFACGLTIRKSPHLMPVYVTSGFFFGNVKDIISGDSIGDVIIGISISDGVISDSITNSSTGKLGDYNVSLSPNLYNITFEKFGYYSYSTNVIISDNVSTLLNVNLTPVSRIGGVVQDYSTKNPIKSANVKAYLVSTVNLTYRNETLDSEIVVSDNHGDFSNINLSINSTNGIVSLYGNNLSGVYESVTHYLPALSDFNKISWSSLNDPGSSLKFQIAFNNDNLTWNYIGPDGTINTYYTTSGSVLNFSGKYLKYRSIFESSVLGNSAKLSRIDIDYNYIKAVPNYEMQPLVSLLSTAISGKNGEFTLVGDEVIIKLDTSVSGYYSNYSYINLTKGENIVKTIELTPIIIPPGSGGGSGGGGSGGSSSCKPRWSCGDWDECLPGGTQLRKCEDISRCGSTSGRPSEKQNCFYFKHSDKEVVETETAKEKIPRIETPMQYGYIPEIESDNNKWESLLFSDVIYEYRLAGVAGRLRINKISDHSIDILFFSGNEVVSLKLGESKKVDFDLDGSIDYIMTLVRVGHSTVSMSFVRNTLYNKIKEWVFSKTKSLSSFLVIMGVFVLSLLLFFALRKVSILIRLFVNYKLIEYYVYLEKKMLFQGVVNDPGKYMRHRFKELEIKFKLIKLRAKRKYLFLKWDGKNAVLDLDEKVLKNNFLKEKRLLVLEGEKSEGYLNSKNSDSDVRLNTLVNGNLKNKNENKGVVKTRRKILQKINKEEILKLEKKVNRGILRPNVFSNNDLNKNKGSEKQVSSSNIKKGRYKSKNIKNSVSDKNVSGTTNGARGKDIKVVKSSINSIINTNNSNKNNKKKTIKNNSKVSRSKTSKNKISKKKSSKKQKYNGLMRQVDDAINKR